MNQKVCYDAADLLMSFFSSWPVREMLHMGGFGGKDLHVLVRSRHITCVGFGKIADGAGYIWCCGVFLLFSKQMQVFAPQRYEEFEPLIQML